MQVGNFRFFEDKTFAVEKIGFAFKAGPVNASLSAMWTDTSFSGAGVLAVQPILSIGGSFYYRDGSNWKIEIAANETSGFSTSRIFDVTDSILVKAKRPEGTSYEQMGGPNTNLTDVDLALITETSTGTSTHVMSFRLNTDESSLGKTDIATCAEPAPITCYP